MNERPDLERVVTDWLRAEAPARAPDRVLALALDRVAVLGQERSVTPWPFSDRSGTNRTTLIAATAALLALLTATAFIGSQLLDDATPQPVPPPVAPVVAPVPPVPPATTVETGTASTELGTLVWTAMEGDSTNIPSSRIFETPSGFAAIEPDLDRDASRFWVSTDGLAWVTVPLPVPATGPVEHTVAEGEHWIWSSGDLRTWRSADFVTWTEVDLSGLAPPAVEGVEWAFHSSGPVTVGSTTVMPWTASGSLALHELLGVTLSPGETLVMDHGPGEPALGDQRVIHRARQTVNGPDTSAKVRVGSIQVQLDGTVVTVVDADREIVLSEIDAAALGVEPATLAEELNHFGFFAGPGTGAVITGSGARALPSPPDLTFLAGIDDRFLVLTDDRSGGPESRLVWTSTDGLDWEPLGPPEFPARPEVFSVDPPHSSPDRPLSANVMLTDEAGNQTSEIWTSTDGLRWVSAGIVSTYPEPGLYPIPAFGGFVATGDDLNVHVSATGAEWSAVDGLDGPRRVFENDGGMSTHSVTRDTVFLVDVTLSGERVMWVLRRTPAP